MAGQKKYVLLFIFLLQQFWLHAQPAANDFGKNFILQTPVLNKSENPEDIIRRNIFVRVSTAKKNVFVGQPFLVTYKLYTTLNRESSVAKEPLFKGCSVIELSAENDPDTEEINGKIYRVIYIRKVLLTPLQEGLLQLDEAKVENIVQFEHADDATKTESFSITLSNQPLQIEVNALPQKNKPLNFSGSVGSYTISAKTDTGTAPVGENIHLFIALNGLGNISGINLPLIKWPEGIEHFDATDTEHINQEKLPITGSRVFDIPFIGTKEGSVAIPPIGFNFFDPASQTYQTVYSKPVAVVFTKAVAKEETMKDIVTEDVSNRKYLWIVPAIAFVVAFVIIVSSRITKQKNAAIKKQQEIIQQKEMAEKAMQKIFVPVKKTDFSKEFAALEKTGDDKMFFNLAKAMLTKALQEKLQSSFTTETSLLAVLKEKFTDDNIAKEAANIYASCDIALYTPVENDKNKKNVSTQLKEVIERLGD